MLRLDQSLSCFSRCLHIIIFQSCLEETQWFHGVEWQTETAGKNRGSLHLVTRVSQKDVLTFCLGFFKMLSFAIFSSFLFCVTLSKFRPCWLKVIMYVNGVCILFLWMQRGEMATGQVLTRVHYLPWNLRCAWVCSQASDLQKVCR